MPHRNRFICDERMDSEQKNGVLVEWSWLGWLFLRMRRRWTKIQIQIYLIWIWNGMNDMDPEIHQVKNKKTREKYPDAVTSNFYQTS